MVLPPVVCCQHVSTSYETYSMNPWPNCTFPNNVHHQGLWSIRLQVVCFPGSDDAPSWEMCGFCMGIGSCFYSMTFKKHQIFPVIKMAWDKNWPQGPSPEMGWILFIKLISACDWGRGEVDLPGVKAGAPWGFSIGPRVIFHIHSPTRWHCQKVWVQLSSIRRWYTVIPEFQWLQTI